MALDLRTTMQAPDYKLPPEVIALLAQAIQQKNQKYQSFGQDIGQGITAGIGAYQQKKQDQKLDKTRQQFAQSNPQLASVAPFVTPENIGQFSGLMKGQQQKPEYSAVSGMMSKSNHPLIMDKFTGQMKEADMEATAGGGSQMANIREKQFGLQDLPSNQSPQTAGGAAYQVKVAARQGKSIVAKPGSPQRTGLASGDLARAILRSAPTEETIKAANFSDNLVTRWSTMKQKLTADPTSVNNPQIRREIYNIFDEMDKSATPFIKNQLDDMESMGFKIPKDVRRRQLGETLPDVPFIETEGSKTNQGATELGGGFSYTVK